VKKGLGFSKELDERTRVAKQHPPDGGLHSTGKGRGLCFIVEIDASSGELERFCVEKVRADFVSTHGWITLHLLEECGKGWRACAGRHFPIAGGEELLW